MIKHDGILNSLQGKKEEKIPSQTKQLNSLNILNTQSSLRSIIMIIIMIMIMIIIIIIIVILIVIIINIIMIAIYIYIYIYIYK